MQPIQHINVPVKNEIVTDQDPRFTNSITYIKIGKIKRYSIRVRKANTQQIAPEKTNIFEFLFMRRERPAQRTNGSTITLASANVLRFRKNGEIAKPNHSQYPNLLENTFVPPYQIIHKSTLEDAQAQKPIAIYGSKKG